jgi:hypothetical protein
MKNSIALIVLILIVASASPSFSDTEGPPWNLLYIVVGVNVLTVTMNGIFSYTDPPRHGPTLLGVVWGTGSAVLGSYLVSQSDFDTDLEFIGWGVVMTATGIASVALALINSYKVSNHMREASINPEISLDLGTSRTIRMGISIDF